MENCSHLYFLSTLACKLAECLDEKDIAILASDLATIGCLLSTILAHRVPELDPAAGTLAPEILV